MIGSGMPAGMRILMYAPPAVTRDASHLRSPQAKFNCSVGAIFGYAAFQLEWAIFGYSAIRLHSNTLSGHYFAAYRLDHLEQRRSYNLHLSSSASRSVFS